MTKKRSNAMKITASALCGLLVWTNTWAAWPPSADSGPLNDLIEEPYLVLLEKADELEIPKEELEEFRKQLKAEEKATKKKMKQAQKELEKEIKGLRKELDHLNKSRSRDDDQMSLKRHELHCQVAALEEKLAGQKAELKHGLPVVYDNRLAKVDLLEKWPARNHKIIETLESGRARQRRFGDVEDIGIRVLKEGQERDIKTGEEAIQDMKAYGLMPVEVEDEKVTAYVQELAERIAAHSDLKVPLEVTVLDSEEINAFALPGGFLFINSGLIEEAETESELAGVIAHEIAHVTARHGAQLMKKAKIANIIYQAAQVAAVLLTGGAAGVGLSYALQYGFMGLGMALNLTLLGVSREYEEEADQLGVQYAWGAGYDPDGFISFFDKLASEKGYVQSASFFRTHPPFFERIVSTFSEIKYLPPKRELRLDSTHFRQVKKRLLRLSQNKPDKKERPTLRRKPKCEPDVSDEGYRYHLPDPPPASSSSAIRIE